MSIAGLKLWPLKALGILASWVPFSIKIFLKCYFRCKEEYKSVGSYSLFAFNFKRSELSADIVLDSVFSVESHSTHLQRE